MLAQTWPARRHLPALIYQPLLEGSSNPWLVYQPLLEGSYDPPISFTSLTWKGATTPWLKATTLSTSMDHVSSIFTLDPKHPLGHNLQATFHHIFRLDPLHTFKFNHTSKWNLSIQTTQNCRIHHSQIAVTQQNRSDISYPILQQTLVFIRASNHINPRILLCILQS